MTHADPCQTEKHNRFTTGRLIPRGTDIEKPTQPTFNALYNSTLVLPNRPAAADSSC